MPKVGEANSPLPTGTPPYKAKERQIAEAKPDDFALLGESGEYPKVNQYIEDTKKYYRRFLPGGTLVSDLTEEERAKWWASADTIITEFEKLQAFVGNAVAAHRKRSK